MGPVHGRTIPVYTGPGGRPGFVLRDLVSPRHHSASFGRRTP